MRHYELVTILSPMLNQDDVSATWDEIKSFITNREAEITAEQTWGTRRLAYPIRKGNYNFLEGSYYLSSFAVDNPFNRELENYLRLHDNVLRALVVRCDGPLEETPAPGPLTAPSRYVPPGRGRRNDGGGPIPEAPAPAAERGAAQPPAGSPSAPPAGTPAPADAPVAPEASAPTPEAAPIDAPVAEAAHEAPAPAAVAPSTETSVAEAAPETPAPAAEAPPTEAPVAEAAPETPAPAPEAAPMESPVAAAAPETPAPAAETPPVAEPAPGESAPENDA